MGILEGFIKTKRYRKLANGSYQLQSEWSSADTTEMRDGTTLTDKMASVENELYNHTHIASEVKAGTLGGQVSAPGGTDYSTNRLRNIVFTTIDPTDGVNTSYVNGTIICVYENK